MEELTLRDSHQVTTNDQSSTDVMVMWWCTWCWHTEGLSVEISVWSVTTPPSPPGCCSCSGTLEERLLCCGNQDTRQDIHIPNKIVPKIQTLPKLIQSSLWSNQTQKSQNPLKKDPVGDPSIPHLSYSPSVWLCPRGRWRGRVRAASPGWRRCPALTWWWWPPWCRAPGRSRAATVQPSTRSQYYMWVWSHKHVSCKPPTSQKYPRISFGFTFLWNISNE